MASTTMIETVTITRPLKPLQQHVLSESRKVREAKYWISDASSELVEIRTVMHAHGNLTASYLWQPGELARRMLGERPAPVPPTRELWPHPHQPVSISTLHVAYTQDDDHQRRASTLPPQPYVPTTVPIEHDSYRPRVCTVGTNTDPPPTILSKVRKLLKKQDNTPTGYPPPGRLTAVPREPVYDTREEENAARRAINGIKKAISGAKNRIAPDSETVDSPKIVYDMPKPGDRMTTTFGAREPRRWCKVPSRESCERRLRVVGGWCGHPRARRPERRQSHPPPRLQITQV